jgi:copper(I)-binding protein
MTLHKAAALAAIIIFVAAHAVHAHEYQLGNLKIDHPWSRTTLQVAKTGAGYMMIRNEGSSADRLIGISSPAAEAVEIHQSIMDGTIMRMRPVPDGLEIGPRQSVKLPARGECHDGKEPADIEK